LQQSNNIHSKKILLGITGGIAAYKSLLLIRLLVKNNFEVKVILTPDAQDFVTPLSVSTLSKNNVYCSTINKETGQWNNHVELALWAQLFVIAPCTANTMAKMSTGICDNLLMACFLSAKCPVMIAPAMDLDMFAHFTTQKNIHTLSNIPNITVLPVGNGELASGLSGNGRMLEPEEIYTHIQNTFEVTLPQNLKNKTVLITAGPTQEAIDPVRYITNASSGKMGVAIANYLHHCGANVLLVLGPTAYKNSHFPYKTIHVTTAQEMYNSCIEHFETADIAIASAAVADYKVINVQNEKIKKSDNTLTLQLEKNKDILLSLGKLKKSHQILVGFALETNNEIENATQKLHKKNLDFIVLNSLKNEGAGFNTSTNKITIIDKYNNTKDFELKDKELVAADIVHFLSQQIAGTKKIKKK
jgi:phosphopantothenoylcysteine decarboxylase / phosphopantothenate---cysteine ligase